MIRNLTRLAALVAAVGLGACDNSLEVPNPNNPTTKSVLGTPLDAENLIGTYYKRWSTGVYGSTTNLEGMTSIMSLMNYSSLANNCQNSHYPFVGAGNPNTPGNVCNGEQFRLYSYMGEVNRVAANFIDQMNKGLSLQSQARDNRDRAYAEFLNGMSLGYAALMHDSLAVIVPGMGPLDAGKLVSYKEGMDSAFASFDRAIALAQAPASGPDGFPLPPAWIPSPTSWTAAEFVKMIRSYRARLRANIARTPAERAAVDWSKVIDDAANGVSSDLLITTSTTAGPNNAWRQQYNSFDTWHQMPAFIIGMADTSGSYAAWIAQPISERGNGGAAFFMVTPDTRFPQGTTRSAQQADFAIASCNAASTACKRYFVNRASGGDRTDGPGWGWSNYDFVRFRSWNTNGDGTARNGNTPFMVKAELDMLQAEGLYRQNKFAEAAALVNITRTKNGLPAITTFDATTPVPGGAKGCVPKVPVAPFNVVACGTLWEALKYEKRIETAYTHYAPWYLDMRGWGDLPKDTPMYWAVPYQDLQARGTAISKLYGTGLGAGNAQGSTAGPSTYGW